MEIEQSLWRQSSRRWEPSPPVGMAGAQVVLVFGGRGALMEGSWRLRVREAYPDAHLMGCSTAGEICGARISDESVVITALRFDHTSVLGLQIGVEGMERSFDVGRTLACALDGDGLKHVLVLSDGSCVNGSELVRGLRGALPEAVTLSGGLAGDGTLFTETRVFFNSEPEVGQVAALGFYGDRLKVGCGSLGGWDPFGPERVITRAEGNRLYELDGHPALDLYRAYLGEHAAGLPATALFFPLSIRAEGEEQGLVRTILGIDEAQHCMIFAGDMPVGHYARLMKANLNRLLDGAHGAAQASIERLDGAQAGLALLISCVGRRMVFKQRVEEELEVVRDVLGPAAALTGFYSYGEISPFSSLDQCELHNQTMTVTVFNEA